MTIYDYFNALTNIGLGEEHTEEFEDAINDTLAMIKGEVITPPDCPCCAEEEVAQ